MKDKRKELIDFLKWIENVYWDNKGIDDCVDTYLRSINSSPCERKVDSNNEQPQEFCKCNHDDPKYFYGLPVCFKCNKVVKL